MEECCFPQNVFSAEKDPLKIRGETSDICFCICGQKAEYSQQNMNWQTKEMIYFSIQLIYSKIDFGNIMMICLKSCLSFTSGIF